MGNAAIYLTVFPVVEDDAGVVVFGINGRTVFVLVLVLTFVFVVGGIPPEPVSVFGGVMRFEVLGCIVFCCRFIFDESMAF